MQYIYSSSSVKFETFKVCGCSCRNIFSARLKSNWTLRWILLIAKDESFFVVMDALNEVLRCRKMKTLLSHSHDVTGRVAANFSNTERFGYISLLHFFKDDAIVSRRDFSSHSGHLNFQDDSSMSTTSGLGRSLPYISMICWYASWPAVIW